MEPEKEEKQNRIYNSIQETEKLFLNHFMESEYNGDEAMTILGCMAANFAANLEWSASEYETFVDETKKTFLLCQKFREQLDTSEDTELSINANKS